MLRFKQFLLEEKLSDKQKLEIQNFAMNPSGAPTPTPNSLRDQAKEFEGGARHSRTRNPLGLDFDEDEYPKKLNPDNDQQDHQDHKGDEESEEAIRTHLDNAGYMGAYDAAGEIAKQAIGGGVGKVAGAVIGPAANIALGDYTSAAVSTVGAVGTGVAAAATVPTWGALNFAQQKAYGATPRTQNEVSPEEEQQTEAKKNKEAKQRQFSREVMNPSGAVVPQAHITNWEAQQRKY